jgi:hypothetical protein
MMSTCKDASTKLIYPEQLAIPLFALHLVIYLLVQYTSVTIEMIPFVCVLLHADTEQDQAAQ